MSQGAIVRVVGWAAALAAVVIVATNYEHLPNELPITRWSSAPRSPLLALRIPSINLMSLVLVEVLSRPLARTSLDAEARRVRCALTLTIGAKALIEATELVSLPDTSALLIAATTCIVVAGLGSALSLGLGFLKKESRPTFTFTSVEKMAAAAAVVAIVILQFAPVF